MIGIGIDTGGTYTDAVIYDMESNQILSSGKALTTRENLAIGIANALDTLDEKLIAQAKMLGLSTTLATNACVENKGSRAKLLMIGIDKTFMENSGGTYASYGFHDLSQLVVIDGKPEKIFKEAKDPDWEAFARLIPEEFSECASIGVVQMFPYANGGRFEKEAKQILEKQLGVPITVAYDMFDEVDVLKRGAGTLLNARLIPLIEEFLEAVKSVMAQRKLDLPIAIVRSDGSLMSEHVTKESPVETLLSGPAASVIGGGALAGERTAVIVDMGGTTTDIALIKDKSPVMEEKGVSIGKWQTMVKGLYVDTFGLGGDSAVRFKKGKLYVDTQRVIPLSLLANEYPEVVDKLKKLNNQVKTHTKWRHEFYVLQRDIAGLKKYTGAEQRICAVLKRGPLLMEELAKMVGQDMYSLPVQRLEEEGILMKSGLTPTDMMIIKGDFSIYELDAAQEAICFLANNIKETPEEVPDAVYDLVIKKMYCNIARILLQQKYPKRGRVLQDKNIRKFIEWSYEDAKNAKTNPLLQTTLSTEIPLIGVGAPIHIFLPRVARLLGTKAVIPREAAVANALGAIAGQIVARIQVKIVADYKGMVFNGFSVFEGTWQHLFRGYEEAEEYAKGLAKRQVRELAKRRGIAGKPEVSIWVEKMESDVNGHAILFESKVQASVMGQFSV